VVSEFNILKEFYSICSEKIIYYTNYSSHTKPFFSVFSTEKNPIQHASPPEVVHTEQAMGQRQRSLGEFYSKLGKKPTNKTK
jgi:hypothetical protein